jgi:lipoprotein-anchoring transpeptidase ErfK/SrfK
MLILAAAAQTPPPSSPQADAAIAAWGVTGSAPQTGSSSHTSGRAFRAPIAPGTPPEQSPKAAEPPASKILVVIDKPTQEMKVFVDNVERYAWKVSTGLRSYDTPPGAYTARSMNEIWYSKQWDDAPMPHAIFFTKRGHAIHGTEETHKLGRPASHGCVRLAPENASTLFALVKEIGLENTGIVLNGNIPREEVKAVSHVSPKQQIRPAKKPAKIVLNKKKPSSKKSLARSDLKKQKASAKERIAAQQPAKLPKRFVDPKFDPYGIGVPRRLSRREWLRLYYSGAPRMMPPGYAPRPRALPRY